MRKVIILGGSGFIGSHLCNLLKKKYKIINFTKKNKLSELNNVAADYVINLCASKPTSNLEDSLKNNISSPLSYLEELLKNQNKVLKWIQVGSYFELQIELGRNDFYSSHKKIFRAMITELSKTTPHLSLHSIILPHVTSLRSDGEPKSRIFPTIITSNKNKTKTTFSNGDQFLPILHVNDACAAIELALISKQGLSAATPVWYPSVKELVQKCAVNIDLIEFKENLNPIDTAFAKVIFPPKVRGFKPQVSARTIIQSMNR